MPDSRPKAYSYVRMSSDLQLKGDSKRRQLIASQEYAQTHGLDLVDDAQLEDIGISAFTGANITQGALGRFLEAIEAGSVEPGSYLLVESLDRITRQSLVAAQSLFLRIIESGINLVTLIDGRVYRTGKTDLTDMIMSLVIMSRAHEESATKARRVGAAWENKRSRASKEPLTAICPAWLTLSADRSNYEAIDERAVIIRSIFSDCANGIGMYSIARRLNQQHVPTFQKSNGWHASYIAKILSNRAAIGEFQPHTNLEGVRSPAGEPIKNYFPAVVEDAIFYRAQFGRAERLAKGRGRKGAYISNIFSGLARCAYCNARMAFENKGGGPKGGQYLVCDNGRRHLGCENNRWRYSDFEASFLAFVRELDIESVVADSAEASNRSELEEEIVALNGEAANLTQLMERTYSLLEKGGAVDFISQKLGEHDTRLREIQSLLASKESERATTVASVSGFYESKTQIRVLVSKLQSMDDDATYKLRAQISAQLKALIATLTVATAGRAPQILKTIQFLEAEGSNAVDVLQVVKAKLEDPNESRRYFTVGFKDGTVRIVVPGIDDALSYEEQITANADERIRRQAHDE